LILPGVGKGGFHKGKRREPQCELVFGGYELVSVLSMWGAGKIPETTTLETPVT
jgi:hypothetical protein